MAVVLYSPSIAVQQGKKPKSNKKNNLNIKTSKS